ncbi:transcription factor bHLH18-like [Glycine soja]|uniref:transcription factor bHLH18-like n=1 Tax=Glycine soja TaxID=3848 RepID=UPI001038E4CD|nr:transcription factor bHLH18-like [Glycine soja]
MCILNLIFCFVIYNLLFYRIWAATTPSSVKSIEIQPCTVLQMKQETSCEGAKTPTRDHIMSERKRRQLMAEIFIALSAIIPGSNKIDKSSVLSEAINYVKQLKGRIAVLERVRREVPPTSR